MTSHCILMSSLQIQFFTKPWKWLVTLVKVTQEACGRYARVYVRVRRLRRGSSTRGWGGGWLSTRWVGGEGGQSSAQHLSTGLGGLLKPLAIGPGHAWEVGHAFA